ncbi:hypothetical protein GYMLUDRAFT_57584 [Collybiopsis luxurians FD-317 M1]|uniref:DDE-1 domain-containing protein n=1 Tax=Collybiopsis luxurians FD-317 M1 TaxID=944289 RepID=A0A0D0D2B8_9AGAR|nr:hypothetical protein GYMLUDRAFT_57584 [Collybiopsis luxurians FD-317 M1]
MTAVILRVIVMVLVLSRQERLEMELGGSGNGKAVIHTYCVACFAYSAHCNPKQILDHAQGCNTLAAMFPKYYKQVSNNLAITAIKPASICQKHKSGIIPHGGTVGAAGNSDQMDIENDSSQAEGGAGSIVQPSIAEYIPLRMQQAAIDLALFQLVLCAALPFGFVENPWFVNFMTVAASNYITLEQSAFFTRLILEQMVLFWNALAKFLKNWQHLTVSFDSWSSHAKDKIYTFHTTLPSWCSIFTTGHVFKAWKLLTKEFPWILNIYDPCHNLSLFLKDLGKLFKDELKIVSATSNYFRQSNLGTAQLTEECKRQNIATGMKSASETHFGTTYHQAKAVQGCMPALVKCVMSGAITFTTKATKWLTPYFKKGL